MDSVEEKPVRREIEVSFYAGAIAGGSLATLFWIAAYWLYSLA